MHLSSHLTDRALPNSLIQLFGTVLFLLSSKVLHGFRVFTFEGNDRLSFGPARKKHVGQPVCAPIENLVMQQSCSNRLS